MISPSSCAVAASSSCWSLGRDTIGLVVLTAVGEIADATLARSDVSATPVLRSGNFHGARMSRSTEARADCVPRSILVSPGSGILKGRKLPSPPALSVSAPAPLLRGRRGSSSRRFEYESARGSKGRDCCGDAKLCDRLTLGDSGILGLLPTSAGLIHCLLEGRGAFWGCIPRGPVGIVGLMGLEGPEGGAHWSPPDCPEEAGRSWRS